MVSPEFLYGWEGNDTIHGGPGHDDLFGEDGSDTIYGGDFKNGQEIIYPGDDDWIYDPGQGWSAEPVRVDLVTDIPTRGNPGVIEPGADSWDNRDENGFFGGRRVDVNDSLQDGLVEIWLHQPTFGWYDFAGKQLTLDWEGDGEVIEVYLDPNDPNSRIYPGYTFQIPLDYVPPDPPAAFASIYVKAVAGAAGEDTALTLTLLDESGEPIEGRPLWDFLYILIVDQGL
jgi:Ca2+-binding RTX toxin-like protein